MTRPITLFTGQWADLPFEEVCRLAAEWGYDGLEIACWGDHFEVDKALADPEYVPKKRAVLDRYGLGVWAVSNHLVGQAVCDHPIDVRHRAILPARLWDDDPEQVRRNAAREMADTARAAALLGVDTVVGFTGSSIWHTVAMFPPVPADAIDAGYRDFADRWHPILDVFEEHGVRFALEVHPSEIAYDHWTTRRTLDAIGHRPSFGLNWDPSHMMWQDIDPAAFILDFADRVYHVDCKDTKIRARDGRRGRLSSHLPWGDPRRAWDFVSTGHGDVPWEECLRALNTIGYTGPLSVEWEDAGMDRLTGAAEAVTFLRHLSRISPPAASFDAAFDTSASGADHE
ncbi:AP endonuclease [Streptomyces sp. Root431]|uniref:sugar phosphate isomerase/epimerase family protein n=1 Tax=Streptomyces sp. Root431 TaxID=1736535 RepID=UPI0006F5BCA0|nr:sugar phosphate isomerase/epimerase family protein [Streptomyces sp. Root431]KQX14907.1 AP endonuclease [Streptomyces sp. Root431]